MDTRVLGQADSCESFTLTSDLALPFLSLPCSAQLYSDSIQPILPEEDKQHSFNWSILVFLFLYWLSYTQ